jgi:hypothetical protein
MELALCGIACGWWPSDQFTVVTYSGAGSKR